MKKLYVAWGLAAGILLAVLCIKIASAPTGCSTQPASVVGGDYFFDDAISVGSIVAGAQCQLGVRFATSIVARTQTAICNTSTGPATINGNKGLLAQCKEGFILTQQALDAIRHHAITTIWVQLGESMAQRRFFGKPSQLCAAGFLGRSQPSFATDRAQAVPELLDIQQDDFAWTQQGFQLREQNRPIQDCADARAEII